MSAYIDIRNHPRHEVDMKRRSSLSSRARLFSPFDALTGFEEELTETARTTDSFEDMAEDDVVELNAAFQKMVCMSSQHPRVTITYFQKDMKKSGGTYITYTGEFRFYDMERRKLCFMDRTEILADCVTHICFISPV